MGRVYYGWVLVGTLAFTELTSWGVLYYAFSVFLVPMQEDLGWSRAALTGAFSLALLLSGVAGVPVGRWLDRHGPRGLMTVGSLAAAGLVLAWSAIKNLTAFYLIWAGIGVAMATVLYEPAFVVVAMWFARRRGRALTVLTFVAGFASVVYTPVSGWLIQTQGWRGALVILATVLALTTAPLHALVLRRRPEDLGLSVDGPGPRPAGAPTPAAPGPERSISLAVAVVLAEASARRLASATDTPRTVTLPQEWCDGGKSFCARRRRRRGYPDGEGWAGGGATAPSCRSCQRRKRN